MKDVTTKLEKLRFSDGQHVIIPQHIQVPDAVKNVLNFGSLDASFGVRENCDRESNADFNPATDSALEETVSKLSSWSVTLVCFSFPIRQKSASQGFDVFSLLILCSHELADDCFYCIA